MVLRKILDRALFVTEDSKRLSRLRPLVTAIDTFLYEPAETTSQPPHIRDSVDLKRVMMLVVFALVPCIIMAIWNTGVQKLVYASSNLSLYDHFKQSYWGFCASYWPSILKLGLGAFVPIMLISYMVGGACEAAFAVIRRHEISEGFLVTGMLYALILPPTLPYWMVALGVAVGVILSKELFGGTGYNILNPALVCRTFLYFTFPTRMSGTIWAGTNPTITQRSILKMNELLGIDGISQATALGVFNTPSEIKRVHVDAIANNLGLDISTQPLIDAKWTQFIANNPGSDLQSFVTGAIGEGGLGLSTDAFAQAVQFVSLKWGQGIFTDMNLFFGNMLGSVGETSTFACLLGAILIVLTGVGSWRTMLSFALGVIGAAGLFQLGSHLIGTDMGAWNPANFDFPIYKQFLMGGLAFGLVFMATDPVSSPDMNLSKWVYGLIIGVLTVVIRVINPAFPEGVMLAILFGNVIAPLLDNHFVYSYRKNRYA